MIETSSWNSLSSKQFLRALTSFFAKDGLEEDKIQIEEYKKLKDRLEMNSLSTEELMLEYFHSLADEIVNVRIGDFLIEKENCMLLGWWNSQ